MIYVISNLLIFYETEKIWMSKKFN